MACRPRTRGRAFGAAASLSVMLCGCSAQAPLAPDPVSASAVVAPIGNPTAAPSVSASGKAPAKPLAERKFVFRFDMVEGALTLVFPDGSALFGTYQGVATNPLNGQPRATLEGDVTGGTGIFAGATGTFTGDGTGGFAGDGTFTVSLRGTVLPASRRQLDLRLTLRGTVASTCTTEAPARLFLDGVGSYKSLGAVTGHLEHSLGTEPCAVIIID